MMEKAMRIAALVSILGALVLPAAAQIGNPAGVDPATPPSAPGVPAPHYANTQDKLFAQLAAEGGMAEVELGKLADGKAGRSSVKEFARRMVQDHTNANAQLTRIAGQAKIPLPGDLAPEHTAMKAALEKASGSSFDRAYMAGQLVDHQKTVILLQYEIGQGQDAELQKFAAETLPVALAHLEMARSLMEELSTVAMQAGSTDRAPSPERPAPRR
jgi:putative membrane protein